MASIQKGRSGAIATLKESLVQRFGVTSRDVVEAEVNRTLAGRSKLEREDLDIMERNILNATRLQRSKGSSVAPRSALARSAPDLKAAGSIAARMAPTPPPKQASAMREASSGKNSAPSRPPLSNGKASGLARSASDSKLVNPPYACCVDAEDDNESERSRVQVVPKYPVPLRPHIKPVDHWDLMVAYDAAKHRQEAENFVRFGNPRNNKAKSLLDSQMLEIKAIKEKEAADIRKEREDMLKTVEENQRLTAEEEAASRAKSETLNKMNKELLAIEEKKRQRSKDQKKKEEDMMTAWLASEATRQEEENCINAELHAKKCAAGREEMLQAIEEKKRQKLAQQAEDRKVVEEAVRRADDAVAKNKAAVQKRMDQIDKNSKTLGAQIAKKDADYEQFMEERLRKALEEGDRAAKQDAERRKAQNEARTKKMIDGLDGQMAQRRDDHAADVAEGKVLQKLWVEQCEDDKRKEQEKRDRARKAREKMDIDLINQIREVKALHPKTMVLTSDQEAAQLAYNRGLLEKMHSEGFEADLSRSFLGRATHKKNTHFPSVGPYEGDIHPTELGVPTF